MTILTENFTTADADTLGPTQTWVEDVGDIDIVSNRARLITDPAVARATATLATDDHYVTAKLSATQGVNPDESSAQAGVIARKAASATQTYYLCDIDWSSDVVRLFRCVTGTFTSLATNVATNFVGTTQYQVLLTVNNSALKTYVDGVAKHSTTDSNITGNLQCGIRGDISGGAPTVEWDDWEAGDVLVAGAGAAAGTSTAEAVGEDVGGGATTEEGDGLAAGTSTATAVGRSTAKAAGSAAGTSTAAAVGKSTAKAVGSAAGSSAATAIARAFALAGGMAAGTSTAAAISQAIATAIGLASGTSTAEAVGENAGVGLTDGDDVQVIQAGGIECSVFHDTGTAIRVVPASVTQISVVQAGGTPIKVAI